MSDLGKLFKAIDRIKELEAERDEYRIGANEGRKAQEKYMELCVQLEEVKAERDALKQDAERYRWLRQMIFDERIIVSAARMLHGEALDKAIDAAMKGEA